MHEKILSKIIKSGRGYKIIRIGFKAFLDFYDLLEQVSGLKSMRKATIEKQVAKILCILAYNARDREVQFWFRRPRETISHHFHNVLKSIIELEEKLLKQPDGSQVLLYILNSS